MQKLKREAIRFAREAGVENVYIEDDQPHSWLVGRLAGRPFRMTLSNGANAGAGRHMDTWVRKAIRRHRLSAGA